MSLLWRRRGHNTEDIVCILTVTSCVVDKLFLINSTESKINCENIIKSTEQVSMKQMAIDTECVYFIVDKISTIEMITSSNFIIKKMRPNCQSSTTLHEIGITKRKVFQNNFRKHIYRKRHKDSTLQQWKIYWSREARSKPITSQGTRSGRDNSVDSTVWR